MSETDHFDFPLEESNDENVEEKQEESSSSEEEPEKEEKEEQEEEEESSGSEEEEEMDDNEPDPWKPLREKVGEDLISNPDLPRPGGREISHFSVKQSEIWVRD